MMHWSRRQVGFSRDGRHIDPKLGTQVLECLGGPPAPLGETAGSWIWNPMRSR
jgi:hypothetical protein